MSTMKRSLSKRQRFVLAFSDPATAFSRDPISSPPTSRFSEGRLRSSKLGRSFFGTLHELPLKRSFSRRRPASAACHTTRIPEEGTPNFTSTDDEVLFSPLLISPEVARELPVDYTLRPLRRGDFRAGYLDVLRGAGNRVGRVVQWAWHEQFNYMRRCEDTYYILVIADDQNVVKAVGTLLVERKFVNGMCKLGRITDVAVSTQENGQRLSMRIVDALVHVAEEVRCSKVEVATSETNQAFHIQCGFEYDSTNMSRPLSVKPLDLPLPTVDVLRDTGQQRFSSCSGDTLRTDDAHYAHNLGVWQNRAHYQELCFWFAG